MEDSSHGLFSEISGALEKLVEEPTLEAGIEVANRVLALLSPESLNTAAEIIDDRLVSLPNAERQDHWFMKHPWMGDERAAFDILDSETVPVQAKFYWMKKRSRQYVSGAVHLTENWEDRDFTRNAAYKVGVDFFLDSEAKSVLVVLSNRGNLRLLELSGRLSNTQIDIFKKWFAARAVVGQLELHDSLWESLRLQSVNNSFYLGVANAFNELQNHLHAEGHDEEGSKLFSSRLLGRIIFVWFLRSMGLVDEKVGYFETSSMDSTDYYKTKLEPLFFHTLNTPLEMRSLGTTGDSNFPDDSVTPYLNGGLFEAHENDWYRSNRLSFPVGYFERLYEHFSNYNFTTDESTPEYEQVAIDPEMLGRVFESLLASQLKETGELARKAMGAYYTPREVVSYMCKESLRETLKAKFNGDPILVRAVDVLIDTSDRDWAVNGTNSIRKALPIERRGEFIQELNSLKILDPACGSGAFPMGMLSQLVRLNERLDPTQSTHNVKMKVLKNSIFGVDIEPMAVEISRLRAWLSLVVEEAGQHSIEPLPNLDFKFVCANSLVGLTEHNLLSDPAIQDQLRTLRADYFDATSKAEKQNIRNQYLELTKPSVLDSFDKRARQIKSFNPFGDNSAAEYFDPENMLGVSEGFDAVIGNPPYIGMKGHADIFSAVRESSLGKRFFSGKMDYLYFFFHLGLDLLRPGGSLCFITTNYYPTASYAKKLVEDIRLRATLTQVINFNEIQIFDSAAGQHNMITLMQRGQLDKKVKVTSIDGSLSGRVTPELLNEILYSSNDSVTKFEATHDSLFKNESLVLSSIESNPVDYLLDIVGRSKVRLGQLCLINQGVVTGANRISQSHISKFRLDEGLLGAGVFIVTSDELAALELDEHELEIVKPYFKNSDIVQFGATTEAKRYLIYADSRVGSLDTRPKLREHLGRFESVLSVGRSSKFPYLTWPRSIAFDGPKIVAPQRSRLNVFGYNEVPWYATSDVYFITPNAGPVDLFAILGLLNSTLYLAWFYNRGKRKGQMFELFQMPLIELPMPGLTPKNLLVFDEIASIAKIAHESSDEVVLVAESIAKIDELVLQLFDFPQDASALLKSWRQGWSISSSKSSSPEVPEFEGDED